MERLALVDGGPPLPRPVGVTPEEQLARVLGPAAARLEMRFANREAYRDFWRAHPAFRTWSAAVEEYVDYDLTGEEPEMRSRVSEAAVRDDSVDLYTGDALATGWERLRHPAVFLRAERGLADSRRRCTPTRRRSPPGCRCARCRTPTTTRSCSRTAGPPRSPRR